MKFYTCLHINSGYGIFFSCLIINLKMQFLFDPETLKLQTSDDVSAKLPVRVKKLELCVFPLKPTCQQVCSHLHLPHCNERHTFSTLVGHVRAPRLSLLLACTVSPLQNTPTGRGSLRLGGHLSGRAFFPATSVPRLGAGDKRAWDGLC